MASPTARALAECKRRGWRGAIVERYISATRRRHDVFGFGDLLVLDGERGALLIQVTTTSNAASRVKKIIHECSEAAIEWLVAGNRIEVWGYARRVHRNKDGSKSKVKRWTLRRQSITARPCELANSFTEWGHELCVESVDEGEAAA